jgi:hypothetical protein
MEPSAFCATGFVDPILFRMEEQDKMTARRALQRQDRWENLSVGTSEIRRRVLANGCCREAARKAFKRSVGFRDWDPEVLALHAVSHLNYFHIYDKILGLIISL